VKPQILELAARLSREGEPFVLATVVWARAPSSGKAGSTALIRTDRTIHGWLGGACAEPTVLREALRAIEEGTPRLLFLGTPQELEDARSRAGVVQVPIACQSEGALEVYVEPVLPSPHLAVIGRSPAVDTLARMAEALGWRTVVVDDGGDTGLHDAPNVITTLDLEEAGVGARSFVVVATQGHYDEDALQRALETPAAYVGLVSSRRRADAVCGYLRDRGVPDEQLARVRAPAGLDLGHLSNQEIAVAILAELVQLRASGELEAVAPPAALEPRHEEIDPVCGMTVDVASARYRTAHEGRTYYFCSAGCLERFSAEPAVFLTVGS
jgi:xanthine dehydrogenase accessory factor